MAEHSFTQQDLEEAYAAGHADAYRELLPFHGVDQVAFPTDREQFDAAVLYERRLLEYHHRVLSWLYDDAFSEEQARARLRDVRREVPQRVAAAAARGSNRVSSTARRLYAVASSQGTLQDAERRAREASEGRTSRQRLARRLVAELAAVRAWLDDRVDAAATYAQDREGARRDTDTLHGLAMYDDYTDFVAEDREGREETLREGEGLPGGTWYGGTIGWTWEDPDRPWIKRNFDVYWLENGEIYAWNRRGSFLPGAWPLPGRERDKQPVILLGCVPHPGQSSAEDLISQLQRTVTGRNTLLVLAEAVAERERVVRRRRAIGADEDDGASDVA